jgi:general secretion pathway protein G
MTGAHRAAWYASPGSLIGYVLGLVAVPVLAGLLSHIAEPRDYGKRVSALATARMLAALLDQYRADQLRLPTVANGLNVLVPTYLDRLPRDPWGNPFIYMGGNDRMWADVMSYGADGQSGGSGNAGDVSARFGPLTASRPWLVQVLEDVLSLLAPLIAFACATWWPWARTVFAGSAGLYGILLLALIGMPLTWFSVLPLALAIVCLAGSFHLLTRANSGLLFTGVAVVLAHTLLAVLVTE